MSIATVGGAFPTSYVTLNNNSLPRFSPFLGKDQVQTAGQQRAVGNRDVAVRISAFANSMLALRKDQIGLLYGSSWEVPIFITLHAFEEFQHVIREMVEVFVQKPAFNGIIC
ncbi:hypothetical protein CKO39_23345 [Rhodopseudomonas palustris]|nr:hypothetical protein CKO39_23345 [Rhodopseudomonas palustris]